jgi:hypothetical protein
VPASVFTVIVAVLAEICVFSDTLTVTLPLLLPDAGLTLHHVWSLDTAHEVLAVILKVCSPLEDVKSIVLVSSEMAALASFWVTLTVRMPISDFTVTVAVLADVCVFSDTLTVTPPLFLPDVGLTLHQV